MAPMPEPKEKRPNELYWRAHAHIWNITFSYVNSMALKCAVELGVADVIHRRGNPTPLPLLLSELSIPPSRTACFRRLMRLLVHAGFFARSAVDDGEEEAYVLTAASETFLVNEKPGNVSPFISFVLDSVMLDPLQWLSRWLTREDLATCFHATHGKTVFELAGEDSSLNSMLNEAMACDANLVGEVLKEHGKAIFGGLSSLVDVGGGNGAMALEIAQDFPEVKCTVFDLPHVVASLEGCTKVEAVAGDMFESVPPADAVLLKWVLHDWSDEECVKILKNCKAAIPPRERGGKVIIMDMVMNTEEATHEMAETQLAFDVYMMVQVPGMQRSAAEWRNIFTAAGFSHHTMMPILGLRSVIELYY